MKIEIGQKYVERDNRFHRVVEVTKIGSGIKSGKIQLNGSSWASAARFNGRYGGYSLAVECSNCTNGTPTQERRYFRKNCSVCCGTGLVGKNNLMDAK
jgi:hypothetical protein